MAFTFGTFAKIAAAIAIAVYAPAALLPYLGATGSAIAVTTATSALLGNALADAAARRAPQQDQQVYKQNLRSTKASPVTIYGTRAIGGQYVYAGNMFFRYPVPSPWRDTSTFATENSDFSFTYAVLELASHPIQDANLQYCYFDGKSVSVDGNDPLFSGPVPAAVVNYDINETGSVAVAINHSVTFTGASPAELATNISASNQFDAVHTSNAFLDIVSITPKTGQILNIMLTDVSGRLGNTKSCIHGGYPYTVRVIKNGSNLSAVDLDYLHELAVASNEISIDSVSEKYPDQLHRDQTHTVNDGEFVGHGKSYAIIKIVRNTEIFQNGFPREIVFTVTGKDVALHADAAGGVMTAHPYASSVIADYLQSNGVSIIDIDVTSFDARLLEEQTGTRTYRLPDYSQGITDDTARIDAIIKNSEQPLLVAREMARQAGYLLIYSNGKWKLKNNYYNTTPTVDITGVITRDDIVGDLSISNHSSSSESFNSVFGVYPNGFNKYEESHTDQFQLDADQDNRDYDGVPYRRVKNLNYGYLTLETNAAAMAYQEVLRHKRAYRVSVVCGIHVAAFCEPGDVVLLNIPEMGWDNTTNSLSAYTTTVTNNGAGEVFVVDSITMTKEQTIKVELREFPEFTYSIAANPNITDDNHAPVIGNLSFSEVTSGVSIALDAPVSDADNDLSTYEWAYLGTDGGQITDINSLNTTIIPGNPGPEVLRLTATDAAGNWTNKDFYLTVVAANSAPIVSINSADATDSQVILHYTITDPDGDSYTTVIERSDDDGATWTTLL